MRFKPLKKLKDAFILLSNDDGIGSFGLRLLENELRQAGARIVVAAPLSEKSGFSHSISGDLAYSEMYDDFTQLPRRIEKIDDIHFGIDGTPADCVHVALTLLLQEKPDLVISGINMGRNLAEDILYSGTVGAAAEAVVHGIPAFALSQDIEGPKPDWSVAKKYTVPLLEKLSAGSFNINTLININYPNIPLNSLAGISAARQGERRFPDKSLLKSNYPDDYAETAKNKITITPLTIDYTDYKDLDKLQKLFNSSH